MSSTTDTGSCRHSAILKLFIEMTWVIQGAIKNIKRRKVLRWRSLIISLNMMMETLGNLLVNDWPADIILTVGEAGQV